MPTYTRRLSGTALILLATIFSGFFLFVTYTIIASVEEAKAVLRASYAVLFVAFALQLLAHLWMLIDPTFTTIAFGENDSKRYDTFIIVLAALSSISTVLLFWGGAYKDCYQEIALHWVATLMGVGERLFFVQREDKPMGIITMKPWIMKQDSVENLI